MALFLSTYVNKVDKKGRVSVPALWRTALAGQTFSGIVVFPSFKYPALEASGIDWMAEIANRLNDLDQFSQEYDDLRTILGDARQLAFDTEGRVVLPPDLCEFAGIDDEASLVGGGASFQIWAPGAYDAYKAEARTRLRSEGRTLPRARVTP
jgi:MraZ protein